MGSPTPHPLSRVALPYLLDLLSKRAYPPPPLLLLSPDGSPFIYPPEPSTNAPPIDRLPAELHSHPPPSPTAPPPSPLDDQAALDDQDLDELVLAADPPLSWAAAHEVLVATATTLPPSPPPSPPPLPPPATPAPAPAPQRPNRKRGQNSPTTSPPPPSPPPFAGRLAAALDSATAASPLPPPLRALRLLLDRQDVLSIVTPSLASACLACAPTLGSRWRPRVTQGLETLLACLPPAKR